MGKARKKSSYQKKLGLKARVRALARSSDPATSHEAASSVNVSALEGRVLSSLREDGPATGRELAARTQLDLNSVGPRIKPLRERGLVRHAVGSDSVRLRRERQYVWEAV